MFSLLVPVKTYDVAKTRLALPDDVRRALVHAIALDTLVAATECPLVDLVAVVTAEETLGREASALGCLVLPDEGEGDLNAVLRAGAARLPADAGAGVLLADLPALRSDELTTALTGIGDHGSGFVADAAGVGTTLMVAADAAGLDPRFGGPSRRRHAEAGLPEVEGALSGLRRDVDTLADLVAAIALGVGPHTSRALAATGLVP